MFYVLPCVILFLCFSVLLALRLPRLGKRELILLLFVRLFDLCLFGLSVSSSSWCLGGAAVCDCGTPWVFLLPSFVEILVARSTVDTVSLSSTETILLQNVLATYLTHDALTDL